MKVIELHRKTTQKWILQWDAVCWNVFPIINFSYTRYANLISSKWLAEILTRITDYPKNFKKIKDASNDTKFAQPMKKDNFFLKLPSSCIQEFFSDL